MDQNLSFLQYLDQAFELEEKDWKLYSPLALAYLGDAVYDLIVRLILVKQSNCQTDKLHRKAVTMVNAGTQAVMAGRIKPLLSKEEEVIYRRGKNSKPGTHAKNASMRDYLKATGVEALIGYLYLNKRYDRIVELMKVGLTDEEKK